MGTNRRDITINYMKARFWWKVRNWWHYPQMFHSCLKPPVFEWYLYKWSYKYKDKNGLICGYGLLSTITKLIIRDIKRCSWRLYWYLRWLQPLRCNGDSGGWRTKVCDWLEDKARSKEV